MVNSLIIISNADISGPGGLFDFGATLPIVAFQFLILMIILNIFLYNPLLNILEQRNEYIITNLAEASKLLNEANLLTSDYEQQLTNVRKETQLELSNFQKIYKQVFDIELNICQKSIQPLLESFITELFMDREEILNETDPLIYTLCRIIQLTTSPIGESFNK